MAIRSMIHLNGNIMAAVDVETTGLDPKKHDLIQVCVLPLDSDMQPNKEFTPFYIDLRPERVENIDYQAMEITKVRLNKLILTGLDPFQAVDLFYAWFKKLPLGVNKRISSLAHNWPFDRGFLIEWLGISMFEEIFDGRFRDTMAATLYCNDRAAFNAERYPYPKHGLKYIATTLGVEYDDATAHDAMNDCIVTAKVYRSMISKGLF